MTQIHTPQKERKICIGHINEWIGMKKDENAPRVQVKRRTERFGMCQFKAEKKMEPIPKCLVYGIHLNQILFWIFGSLFNFYSFERLYLLRLTGKQLPKGDRTRVRNAQYYETQTFFFLSAPVLKYTFTIQTIHIVFFFIFLVRSIALA